MLLTTARPCVQTVCGDHRAAVHPDLLALSSASSGSRPVGNVASETSQLRLRGRHVSLLPRDTVLLDLFRLPTGSDDGG